MKNSVEQMAYRLLDTSNFLETFVDREQQKLNIAPEQFQDFIVRGILCIICNQSSLMTYFLEKENYPGLPGDIEIRPIQTESNDDKEESSGD